ncbi:MAG: methyl-accepting chemotaxis protein [Gammaproteobacteria bacterium]|nr:methyl-accepting chemotaxis protein [Gammaproteobacteria bacterium]
MFRNFTISLRFIVTTVVSVILILSLTLLTAYQRMSDILYSAEELEMNEIFENIMSLVKAEGRLAQSMSALVAGMPQVQAAFDAGDREALQAFFAAGFPLMKEKYGVRQFQFHTPPATSFLRVHKWEKFGDDLSSFRQTVVETNRARAPVSGLEVGVAGLGVRGVSPVIHAGRHLGSVEFGMSFGQSFFDVFSKEHGVDLVLYIDRNGAMEPFASTLEDVQLLDTAQLRSIMQSSSLFMRTEFRGTPVAVFAEEVKDFSGKPIGVLMVAKDRSSYAEAFFDLAIWILLLGLVAVGITALVVWLISRSVSQPIKQAALAMEGIASLGGDLSVRMEVTGKDEIARLSAAYNRFADKTESMVKQVTRTVTDMDMRVSELSNLAEQTNAGVNNQHQQTTQVATAVTEMSATVREVAENSTHTAEAANRADQQANAGRSVVRTSVESINKLATEVGEAAGMVRQVEEDSERIGSVLGVIRGIADQTNLLALNAAIEAARAGEQGRGFAVVADEVRTLAQRTQDSTEEIQEMIESLQRGVNGTVSIMAVGQQQAAESVEQANQALLSLDEITQAVDSISSMSAQIATAAEEQSAVVEDINQSVSEITLVADKTASDSAKSAESSGSMAENIEQLIEMLSHFRTDDSHGLELMRAKSAHLMWKTKVRGFLDGRVSLDERSAFSHHHCGLGQWMDAVGRIEFKHIPEMSEIEAPHRELHETIKRIHDLKQQGRIDQAEREYEKIGTLSQKIVTLIGEIDRKIH